MKKKLFTIGLFLLMTLCYSQQGINYKALIKDSNGNIVANNLISVQFIIYQGSALTNNVYEELHTPTTDGNGLIVINIGEGITSDVFTDINWNSDSHFLNVQIDIGSGFVDLVTTQFKTVPYAQVAGNVTGLEAIDEGSGIGWRLVGSDSDNFGNIGFGAIDLSLSSLNSITYGATGTNATAMGIRVSSNGDSSIALGSDSTASDDFSTAIGAGVTASGGSSTALGVGSQATENSSTAIGYFTNALGFASTTLGYYSEALGSYSTAMGRSTNAESLYSMAIGSYNVGGGSPTVWSGNDPLFEIGNGQSNANRSNALTVRKNGTSVINSQSTGLSINAEGIGLSVTNSGSDGVYVINSDDNGISINNSGNNGIIITDPSNNGLFISGATNEGIVVSADGDGLVVSADDEGARITGDNVGVYASGGPLENDVPDIILGSHISQGRSDDGIISTNPLRSGSDMFLRSYDAVVVQLDYDNDENGNFRIRNGNSDVVFDVNEAGNLNIEGRLRIGTGTINNINTNFLELNKSTIPSSDGQFSLGAEINRWANLWAVDGTINTSDRREKKNIKDLNYGLSEVLQMQPVSFNWKNKNNQDTKLGLIAQDLQTLIPEVVISHTWKKNKVTGALTKKNLVRLGVYYSDLVPVLIKAIQEQQEIIETEKSINAKQSSQLEALLHRIENLESNTSN